MPKLLDLTDRTIGRLTVLGPAPEGRGWRVRCTCGTETEFSSRILLSGDRGSCGCAKRDMRIDLTGATFGMLEVKELAPRIARQQGTRWSCKCSCGRKTVARAKDLRNGNTTSCGCRTNRLVVSRGELTPRQLAALGAIGRAPNGLRCADLVPLLGISLGATQRNVHRLASRGLVVRRHVAAYGLRWHLLSAGSDVLYGAKPPRRPSAPPGVRQAATP